jgi:stage II sporulation protein D
MTGSYDIAAIDLTGIGSPHVTSILRSADSRNMKFVAALAIVVSVIGCVAPEVPSAARGATPETVRVLTHGQIAAVSLEDYVLGSALSEVSPVGESPKTTLTIFEVQAIIARTYAIAHLGRHGSDGYDLCDGTHCQLYQPERIGPSRFTDVAREAVRRTEGTVLLYGSKPADALFHSDCGGHTADASAVWGGASVPYLEGAADRAPGLTHHVWTWTVPSTKLRAALDADTRSAVGARLQRIQVVSTDRSGRADEIELAGTSTHQVRGEELRAIVNRVFGDRALQSTKFHVTKSGDTYRFDGAGFGHGVGLCQVGAAARARAGEAVTTILQAYYPGTSLARIPTTPESKALFSPPAE